MFLHGNLDEKISGLCSRKLISFTVEFDDVIRRTSSFDGDINLLFDFKNFFRFALLTLSLFVNDLELLE